MFVYLVLNHRRTIVWCCYAPDSALKRAEELAKPGEPSFVLTKTHGFLGTPIGNLVKVERNAQGYPSTLFAASLIRYQERRWHHYHAKANVVSDSP